MRSARQLPVDAPGLGLLDFALGGGPWPWHVMRRTFLALEVCRPDLFAAARAGDARGLRMVTGDSERAERARIALIFCGRDWAGLGRALPAAARRHAWDTLDAAGVQPVRGGRDVEVDRARSARRRWPAAEVAAAARLLGLVACPEEGGAGPAEFREVTARLLLLAMGLGGDRLGGLSFSALGSLLGERKGTACARARRLCDALGGVRLPGMVTSEELRGRFARIQAGNCCRRGGRGALAEGGRHD